MEEIHDAVEAVVMAIDVVDIRANPVCLRRPTPRLMYWPGRKKTPLLH